MCILSQTNFHDFFLYHVQKANLCGLVRKRYFFQHFVARTINPISASIIFKIVCILHKVLMKNFKRRYLENWTELELKFGLVVKILFSN